jgi:hypothetical protein
MAKAKSAIPGQRQSTRTFLRTWGTEEGEREMQHYRSTGSEGVHAIWLEHWRCEKGAEEVQRELDAVTSFGGAGAVAGGLAAGEGLMLVSASAQYQMKRSNSLLKIKRFTDDEAIVLEHIQGKGKFADVMGALKCRLRSGAEFKVGTGFNDDERARPPPVGTVITVKVGGGRKLTCPVRAPLVVTYAAASSFVVVLRAHEEGKGAEIPILPAYSPRCSRKRVPLSEFPSRSTNQGVGVGGWGCRQHVASTGFGL